MSREYTPQEAAVLAGAKLGAVQKAITDRAIEARVKRGRRYVRENGVYVIAVATSAPSTWRIPLREIKDVVFQILRHPDRPVKLGPQRTWQIDAGPVMRTVGQRMRLYERARNEFVERNPSILGGTPVIKGTRLNVYALAGRLTHGETIDALLNEYPSVTREQLEAALLYAKANPLRGRPGGRPWATKKKSRGS